MLSKNTLTCIFFNFCRKNVMIVGKLLVPGYLYEIPALLLTIHPPVRMTSVSLNAPQPFLDASEYMTNFGLP